MGSKAADFEYAMLGVMDAAECVKDFASAVVGIGGGSMDEPLTREQMGRLYDLIRNQREALDSYAREMGW